VRSPLFSNGKHAAGGSPAIFAARENLPVSAMRLAALIFLTSLTLCFSAAAQTGKARRCVAQALRLKAERKFDAACARLQAAIRADKRAPQPYAVLGGWLMEAHLFGEAAAVYNSAASAVPGADTLFAAQRAEALLRSGDAAGAASAASRLKPTNPLRARLQAASRFAGAALAAAPSADSVEALGPRINTSDPETFPVCDAGGRWLLYTRRVGGVDDEFFRAVPDSCGGWFMGRALPAPPNTPAAEMAQMVSADGHYLFFTRCETRSENGWAGGGCDLYMAYTADTAWSQPEAFGATINTPAYEGAPALSADNRELFFASDRADGYGGMDLWVSRFEDGLWQVPKNLGPEVNTAGDETAPFLHADGETLFFSSNGHAETLGGRDLYRCRRGRDSVWTSVQNLGRPLNSGADEGSITVSPDGRYAHFSSDRGKPAGDYDLYRARFRPNAAPPPALFVAGAATDSTTGERLNYTRILVYDAQTGERLSNYLSNRGDGSYTLVLRPGRKYALFTDRIGYTERYDTLYYDAPHTAPPAVWNAALLPADYVAPVYDSLLVRLHFDKNVVRVTDDMRAALVEALKPLAGAASSPVQVLVNSYTDDSGTPLLNEQISELRARLVADAIRDAGIGEGATIEAKGWADAAPLVPNDTDENRKMNRRVEVVLRR